MCRIPLYLSIVQGMLIHPAALRELPLSKYYQAATMHALIIVGMRKVYIVQ